MSDKIKTNKLSIYLIKDEYPDAAAILKSLKSLRSQTLPGVGTLYFGESHPYPPSWLKTFFGGVDLGVSVLNSSSRAIILAPIEAEKGRTRLFAIPFGYGWSLMNEGVWEERFGLKLTLNTVDPNSIRSIEKQNISSVPKHTKEQMARDGEVANFGIDVEQDLMRSVTGRSTSERFGKTITGKDALSVSVKVDLSNIKQFLHECWRQYQSNAYKKDFGFIDQIGEIKDPRLIDRLNETLLKNINEDTLDKTWMAVPEIIDWANVKGFRYSTEKPSVELKDDIHVRTFVASLQGDGKQPVDLGGLKKNKVYCVGAASEEVLHSWRVYDCMYCEVVDGPSGKLYLLSNGKWYQVETEFAELVNNDYNTLRDRAASIELPAYKHSDEYDYNKAVAASDGTFCCMDRENIVHGGGYSKIEFCDLYTKNRKLIHVKHYGGSSVLSHLFSQGVVSGELFLADSEFRKKVDAKLSESHKFIDPLQQPNAKDYEVIFAIISMSPKKLDLPFFSKVSLRNARRRLETYGYKVSFQKITGVKP